MARPGGDTGKLEARIRALEGALKKHQKTVTDLQKLLEKKVDALEKDMKERTKHNNKQLVKSRANQDSIEARVAKLEKSGGADGPGGQSQRSRGRIPRSRPTNP